MDRSHFESRLPLSRKIELEIGKGEGYVFIDEIQRKEYAGAFLKGIYDMKPLISLLFCVKVVLN